MSDFANIPKKDFNEMFDTNFIKFGQFSEELEKFHFDLYKKNREIRKSLTKRDRNIMFDKETQEKYANVLIDCKKEDAEFLDKIQEMYACWCQQKYIEYKVMKGL